MLVHEISIQSRQYSPRTVNPVNKLELWTSIAWEGKEILLTSYESTSFVYFQYNYYQRNVLVDWCWFLLRARSQFWGGILFQIWFGYSKEYLLSSDN